MPLVLNKWMIAHFSANQFIATYLSRIVVIMVSDGNDDGLTGRQPEWPGKKTHNIDS